jgi:hypothetical protein
MWEIIKTFEFTQTLKNQNCGIEQLSELISLWNFYSILPFRKLEKLETRVNKKGELIE